jgi:predicted butyrate kinase (DUF1464 family)
MDPDIRPGSIVNTQDGHLLGVVGEIEGDAFQVQALVQPDYWLPLRSVAQANDEQVAVAFYLAQLDDYRRLSPAA